MATETERGTRTTEPEVTRRTGRLGRRIAVLVAVVLAGAIGLTVYDVVGQSDREVAAERGSAFEASTTARDFGFVPKLLIIDQPSALRVKLSNQAVHTHTFTIDALGIDVVIPPGETKVVRLDPPADGRYLFYCRFHQSLGMRGYVVVGAREGD